VRTDISSHVTLPGSPTTAESAVCIQTERLELRPFSDADLNALAAYRNNAEWMRFQGFKCLTRQEYSQAVLGFHSEEDGVQLAMVLRASGLLAGDLYYRREGDACHIGYTIAPEFARRGYASEAVKGFLRHLRSRGFREALAEVSPENQASRALLAKLGFSQQGVNAEGDLCFSLSLR
jgi:[ribosomal protein S5]-alanine N-acetyltransferase